MMNSNRMIQGAAALVLLAAAAVLPACGDDGSGAPGRGGIDEEAAFLLRRGKVEEARVLLRDLDPGRRDDADAVYIEGALALHEALGASDPAGEAALERAEALVREALKKDPSRYLSRVLLGKILGIQGSRVEGIKILDAARDDRPDRADAYFELGRIYLDSDELSAACDSVTTGLEKEPERADGYMFLGDILFDHRRQPDEGLKAMRTALKLDPELPGAADKLAGILLVLARKTLSQKKFDDTLGILEEVSKIDPENPGVFELRGLVFDQTNRIEEAVEEFRKYYEADPAAKEALFYYASILIKHGYQLLLLHRRDEGLEQFRKAVDLKAPEVDVSVVSRLLDDASREEANKARTLFREASALLAAGRAEDALKLLRESLELLPENPYARHQAGIALDMLNRQEEAVEELKLALRQAEELKIKLPATYLKLAEISIKAERYEEGKEYLDRHAELFPEMADSAVVKTLRRLLLLK